MAFKGISNIVIQKSKLLQKKEASENKIDGCFRDFMTRIYGDSIVSKINFALDYKYQILTIQTDSKVFANELVLKSDSLKDYLSKNSIDVKQIIIK